MIEKQHFENIESSIKLYYDISKFNLVGQISGENNYQILADVVDINFKNLFKVEFSVLLFFIDNNLIKLEAAPGKYRYTQNKIQYSSMVGLTGVCVSEKKIISIDNPKMNKDFSSAIDNISGILNVRNITIIPIMTEEKEVLGVIQLLNSKIPLDNIFFV